MLGMTGAANPATSQSGLSQRGASASRSVCALLKWLARPVFLNITTHRASQVLSWRLRSLSATSGLLAALVP